MSTDEWHVYLKDRWVGPLSVAQVTLALRQEALGPKPRLRCGEKELPLVEAVARLTSRKPVGTAVPDSAELAELAHVGLVSNASSTLQQRPADDDPSDTTCDVAVSRSLVGQSTTVLTVGADTAVAESASPEAARRSAFYTSTLNFSNWPLWVIVVSSIAVIAGVVVWSW